MTVMVRCCEPQPPSNAAGRRKTRSARARITAKRTRVNWWRGEGGVREGDGSWPQIGPDDPDTEKRKTGGRGLATELPRRPRRRRKTGDGRWWRMKK